MATITASTGPKSRAAATTVLYLIPPALRGLVVGLGALALLSLRGQRLEERRMLCYAVCIVAAVCTTLGNTLVNWLDSVLMGYYFPGLILGDFVWRLIVGMINAVVMSSLAIPLVKALRQRNAVSL